MAKINHMDRWAFSKTEVGKELESMVVREIQKKARLEKLSGIISDTEKATQSIEKANQSAKELVTTLSTNLANDGVIEEIADEDIVEDISDEDFNLAKDSLLEELRSLSYKAADEKNIKLAYQIERSIDELEEMFLLENEG